MMKLRISEAFENNIPEWLKQYLKLTKEYGRNEYSLRSHKINFIPKPVPKDKRELMTVVGDDFGLVHYVNPETQEDVVWNINGSKPPYITDPRTGQKKSIKALPFSVITPYIQEFGVVEDYDASSVRYDRLNLNHTGSNIPKDDPSFERKSDIIQKKKAIMWKIRLSLLDKARLIDTWCLSSRASDNITPEQKEQALDLVNELNNCAQQISDYEKLYKRNYSYHMGKLDSWEDVPYNDESFTVLFDNMPRYKQLLKDAEEFFQTVQDQEIKPVRYELIKNKFYCEDYEIDDLFDLDPETARDTLRQNGWLRGKKVYIPKGTVFTLAGQDYYYEYIKIYGGPLDGLRLGFVDDGTLSRNYLLKYSVEL